MSTGTRDRDQEHPQEKEMQKSKMAIWGGLTNSCEKKRSKKQRRKERYKHMNAEFQGEIRKLSSVISARKWKKPIELGRLEISSRKLEIPREYFMQRWAQ